MAIGYPPTESFPGMWVAPMTDLQDNRGEACAMLDACQGYERHKFWGSKPG